MVLGLARCGLPEVRTNTAFPRRQSSITPGDVVLSGRRHCRRSTATVLEINISPSRNASKTTLGVQANIMPMNTACKVVMGFRSLDVTFASRVSALDHRRLPARVPAPHNAALILLHIAAQKPAGRTGGPYPQYPHLPTRRQYGGAGLGPLGSALGGFAMADWKTELEALVKETTAFAKSHGVEPPMPRTIAEPNRIPPLTGIESEREEIRQRVANFKANQQRFIRDREDYAESKWKRMLASSGS